MRTLCSFWFCTILFFASGCKQRQDAQSETLAANNFQGIILVALDGPRDKGEINRAVAADLERCLANPLLTCRVFFPAGDRSYVGLFQACKQTFRCQPFFFRDARDLLAKLEGFSRPMYNIKVGLLIGHHTGNGIWDHPELTPNALDRSAGFPLVMRMCSSAEFAAGQDGLVPVGDGLLAESDLTHVEIIRRLLQGGPTGVPRD